VKRPVQRPTTAKLARSLALVTLLTALAPWTAAQRTAHASSRPVTSRFNHTANLAFRQNAHGFHRSPHTSLPFPFLSDFFDPDDLYSTGYPVASQPPIILLQATSALAGSSDYLTQPNHNREPATPTQPLMIERQNGRYVRITSTAANGEPLPIEPTHAQLNNPKPALTEPGPQTLPPAVLVFRDGHTEEVRDYAIADGTLYARGDYYTDGYWNKIIPISALNVAVTLQANTKRNVNFVLPTSPNEVITRP
jgi:hypothetical protein